MEKKHCRRTAYQVAMDELQDPVLASQINEATRNFLISKKSFSRYCSEALAQEVCYGIKSLKVKDLSKVFVSNKPDKKIKIGIRNKKKPVITGKQKQPDKNHFKI